MRGGESNFARVLVDGVPVNEPGGAFNFGSQLPLELDRVEVVRGATSSLYGTDALAGVVQLVTRQADRRGPAERAGSRREGGTFAWRRFQGGTSGRHGALDWNAGVVRLDTDNQEPNSDFGETAGAASLGAPLWASAPRCASSSAARTRVRRHARPDRLRPSGSGRPLRLVERGPRERMAALGRSRSPTRRASDTPSPISSRATRSTREPTRPRSTGQTGAYPISDFPDPDGFQNDVRRLSAGYQAEIRAGGDEPRSRPAPTSSTRPARSARAPADLLSPSRTNVGAYLQDRLVVGRPRLPDAGGRVEHNDNFGTKVVPRVAVAWLRFSSGADSTTVRASAGAGIKEPDFFQSFGVSFYAQGNPDLKPERSRTYDVGVEQRLAGDRVRAQATFFHHDYFDQIAYQLVDPNTFQGTYVNLGKTRARGVELAVEASPVLALEARGLVHLSRRRGPRQLRRLRSRLRGRPASPAPAQEPGLGLGPRWTSVEPPWA